MKQLFSGVFCFLWKQKRKSRDIKNAMVWILQLWNGWKEDRSLSQRWLVGHSLTENNDALLPWAFLWLLFLSLEMLERKQQERISEPVLQQYAYHPACWEPARSIVAMPGKVGEQPLFCSDGAVSLDCAILWVQSNGKGSLVFSNSSKNKGGF